MSPGAGRVGDGHHASWAEQYETVMARTFGALYDQLTTTALDEVRERLPHGGTVLDVGAGCGRLAIPLAEDGNHVTAVESSRAMLDELLRRAGENHPRLEPVHARAADYRASRRHDLALCVFTVVAYVLTDDDLLASFGSISDALVPGGLFLLDVPEEEVFAGFDHESGDLIRTVAIDPVGDGLYRFDEHTTVRTPAGPLTYREEMTLRQWSVASVLDALTTCGFEVAADVHARFSGLGSHYLLMRRSS